MKNYEDPLMRDLDSSHRAKVALKALIRTAKTLLSVQDQNKVKLQEAITLEKDKDVGMELTKEQVKLLERKNGFLMIKDLLNELTKSIQFVEGQNEDELIELFAERIFLGKKIEEEELIVKEKERETLEKELIQERERERERDREREREYKAIVEAAKLEQPKHEQPRTIRDEVSTPSELREINTAPNVRVPYAWKNGIVFDGVRQRKYSAGKKKYPPAKEYRRPFNN